MKNAVRLTGILLAAFLFVALPAVGQNSNLNFNGGYQGDVWCGGSEGCVATGDYDGTINGQTVGPGGSIPGMICDDYNHNIVAGESWTANGVSAASLLNTGTGAMQFASIGIAGYTELAYVVNQMFSTSNSTQQSVFSQVIWAITGGVKFSQLSAAAQTLYTWVTTHSLPSLSTYANLYIYTPTDQTQSGPQEMWGEVPVPEGGTALMYLLLTGAACFGAMYYSRNQRAKRATA
jgi:hypothetical protein